MDKPRIIKDFEKLTSEELEQVKLVYPRGFVEHLIEYKNKDGETKKGLPVETDKTYYLIRMSIDQAEEIVKYDDDYDEFGNLSDEARVEFQEKHDDVEWLEEYNNNEDNFFEE